MVRVRIRVRIRGRGRGRGSVSVSVRGRVVVGVRVRTAYLAAEVAVGPAGSWATGWDRLRSNLVGVRLALGLG